MPPVRSTLRVMPTLDCESVSERIIYHPRSAANPKSPELGIERQIFRPCVNDFLASLALNIGSEFFEELSEWTTSVALVRQLFVKPIETRDPRVGIVGFVVFVVGGL